METSSIVKVIGNVFLMSRRQNLPATSKSFCPPTSLSGGINIFVADLERDLVAQRRRLLKNGFKNTEILIRTVVADLEDGRAVVNISVHTAHARFPFLAVPLLPAY